MAALKLTAGLKVGDEIQIKGSTTDFTQKVEIMQVDHNPIEEAKPGDDVGLKVAEKVRQHDKVYRL